MKNKINIFNFSLVAWFISLFLNLLRAYRMYQNEGYSAAFAAGIALMVIIWFELLLLIMDVFHPISKHMLHKEMERKKIAAFIGLLFSDVMLLLLIFLIVFVVSSNHYLLMSFVLFTFWRTAVRRSFYRK